MGIEYRNLGKTGLRVAALGLGGIPIQRVDAEATGKLLCKLADEGVNFIDTARGYTVSEQYIGEGLAAHGLRDRYYLATKSMSRTAEAMAADIETSLKNLQTDHIELYQMHNLRESEFETAFGPGGAIDALRAAVKAGKVGHIGGTAHSPRSLMLLLERPEIETVMFPFNIVENNVEEALALAAERGVGFIAMKPLAGGNITDVRLALRYILQDSRCSIAIPGMATIDEAEQNLAAVRELSPLSEDELAAAQAIRDELGNDFCRRCGYCAPCTAGIDIASCFVMKNYADKYGLADWATTRYNAMSATAGNCKDCGVCETRCPYNLPIRSKLRAVAALFGK